MSKMKKNALLHLDWRFASSFVMYEGWCGRKENVTRDDKGGI
ncbi:hypothetical protein [Bacillus sp. NPDC093026]